MSPFSTPPSDDIDAQADAVGSASAPAASTETVSAAEPVGIPAGLGLRALRLGAWISCWANLAGALFYLALLGLDGLGALGGLSRDELLLLVGFSVVLVLVDVVLILGLRGRSPRLLALLAGWIVALAQLPVLPLGTLAAGLVLFGLLRRDGREGLYPRA